MPVSSISKRLLSFCLTAAAVTANCPSSEFMGRTVYLPIGACYKVELFPGGKIERDTDDQTCSETTFTSDLTISSFALEEDTELKFDTADGGVYSGKFSFEEDSSLTGVTPVINALNNPPGTFDLTLTFPSCDTGPIYPCKPDVGSTVFVPIAGMCFKIEMFDGGVLSGDPSDPTCANPASAHIASLTVSEFDYSRGDRAYFSALTNGYSGYFDITEDGRLSDTAPIEGAVNHIDNAAKEFEITLTYPSCDWMYGNSTNCATATV